MNLQQVHMLIDQGLQSIGVFAYSKFTPEEINMEINKVQNQLVKSAFSPIRQDDKFQYDQETLDRIRILHRTHQNLTITEREEDYVIAQLPEDYMHLVRCRALVVYNDSDLNHVDCNDVNRDELYLVSGGDVYYNNTIVRDGETFLGLPNKGTFQLMPGSKAKVAKISGGYKTKVRITESAILDEVLGNSLSKTNIYSPIGEIAENKILIYFSNFTVNNVIISYIRKPTPVTFNSQRFTQGTTLIANTKYEVAKGTIVYSGNTYSIGETFLTNSGTSFTGTGEVKFHLDGDLLFPEHVCYDIIDQVIRNLSILSEQSQQKVVNLAENKNVPI